MSDVLLSSNFSLSEFNVSSQHPKIARAQIPADWQINNLFLLSNTILQPARDFLGKPIYVSSGLRLEPLNSLVSNYPKSLHRLGKAADLQTEDPIDTVRVYQFIRDKLPFAWVQLIMYTGRDFLHVALHHFGVYRQLEIRN